MAIRIIKSLMGRLSRGRAATATVAAPTITAPTNEYWQQRRHLTYYRKALEYAETARPRSLLDVGGSVTRGCRYLAEIDCPIKVSIELPLGDATLEGVVVIKQDFLAWSPDRAYDVVLCLQVLEHLEDPERFAAKLFAVGNTVVISVPYKWQAGKQPGHIHDPVDESKLRQWTNREPTAATVVDKRLICLYSGTATA